MTRTSRNLAGLALLLALTMTAGVEAQQHHDSSQEPTDQKVEEKKEGPELAPMTQQMQRMMQQMHGMMQQMHGMGGSDGTMGGSGMMGRGGMSGRRR
jgi:hypothetical protein